MSGVAPARCQPPAGSSRSCWPRSELRARRARRGFAGSPRLGSPAPAARSARGSPGRLLACPAADRGMSNAARPGPGANDGSFPAVRRRCPPVARQQPSKRCEDGPISRSAFRPSTCRRSTANSCRKTRISTSFAASDRQRNTINPTSCRNSQYRHEMTIHRSCQPRAPRAGLSFRHPHAEDRRPVSIEQAISRARVRAVFGEEPETPRITPRVKMKLPANLGSRRADSNRGPLHYE